MVAQLKISQYNTVKFWLNKSCGSEKTKDTYLKQFGKFCNHLNVNPDALIQKWKTVRYNWKKRQEFLDEWSEKVEVYTYNELENLASMTKTLTIAVILSFFKHNKIPLEVTKPKHPHVTYHNKDITQEQIKRILKYCTVRDKTFYLMMVESGLRPLTLCQLKFRDIKDEFKAKRIPMKIDLPASILKDRVGHRFSFIGEDSFKALNEYLSTRLPINDNDYVFIKEKRGKNEPVTPSSFSTIFSTLIVKLEFDKPTGNGKPKSLRMYCLRKYFRNNIRVRDTSYRKFWMGRAFGVDEHYLTRDVETHREVYEEAYPSFRIFQPETELTSGQVEKLKDKLAEEIEAKIRAEYEQSLQKQVKEIIREEMRQIVESDPQTRYIVEDFIQAQFNVKPERVSFSVALSENNTKTITVLGYWSKGKYIKLDQPAKIITH